MLGNADLVLFKTVLEDVLHNKAAGFTESNIMPHATEGLIDILHNLRGGVGPTEFEQLLPDVAGVAVDDRLGNTT